MSRVGEHRSDAGSTVVFAESDIYVASDAVLNCGPTRKAEPVLKTEVKATIVTLSAIGAVDTSKAIVHKRNGAFKAAIIRHWRWRVSVVQLEIILIIYALGADSSLNALKTYALID